MVDSLYDEMFLTLFCFIFREAEWEDCPMCVSDVSPRYDLCMSRQCMDGREGDADVGGYGFKTIC